MRITICENKKELGMMAAIRGAVAIKDAIRENGCANVAFVTGNSQIQLLESLRLQEGIEWDKVSIFLLDEYLGIEDGCPASSETFIKKHFLDYIPEPASFYPISRDEGKAEETVRNLNGIISRHPLDAVFACVGENGHLAFNDPPADFDTTDPYIVIELAKRSKRQQVNEGWFKTVDDVPSKVISMSIHMLLSAKHIIVSCPDQRKAKAVAMTLYDDITPISPCASLRRSADCDLYLDRQSSCLILGDRRS